MKRVSFSLFVICIVLSVIFNLGCKNCDEIDARGSWEITLTGLNGDSAATYTFSGSQTRGTITGGGSEAGTGTYDVSGENISLAYDSNLAGGFNYKFTGYFVASNEMKGTGIASQALGPEYPSEREFEWQARRK